MIDALTTGCLTAIAMLIAARVLRAIERADRDDALGPDSAFWRPRF